MIVTPTAASVRMASTPSQHGNVVLAVSSRNTAQHARPMYADHADHCCGKATPGGCHCDAMCGGGLMLPVVPASFALAWFRQAYLSMQGTDAPAPDPVPPLRPPVV